MVAYGFYGESNSGKTTTIERILEVLSSKYEIIVIKHTHLNVKLDDNGDTKRFRNSGAYMSCLSAREQTHILADKGLSVETLLSALEPLCDMVLVEGFRDAKIPKFAFGETEITEGTIMRCDENSFDEIMRIID